MCGRATKTCNWSILAQTVTTLALLTQCLDLSAQTIVGAIAFPDFLYSFPNVTGLTLSMVGAVWYAWQSALRVRSTEMICLLIVLCRKQEPMVSTVVGRNEVTSPCPSLSLHA